MGHNDSIMMNDDDHRFHKNGVEVVQSVVEEYVFSLHDHVVQHCSTFAHVYWNKVHHHVHNVEYLLDEHSTKQIESFAKREKIQIFHTHSWSIHDWPHHDAMVRYIEVELLDEVMNIELLF